MLNLLSKDFKLMFGEGKSLAKRIIQIVFTFFFIAFFIGIEVFLFTTILQKIERFNNAPIAFLNLFLFIISILIIISGIINADKLFFNEKDIEQLSVHPISNSKIVLSKLIFLFLSHYAMSVMFVLPVLIAYGANSGVSMNYYYRAIFYPVLSFIFEMGVSLILVYPYWLLRKFLKKHFKTKFVLVLVILFIGCFLYSQVLNIFIEIVAGNNINSLFTTDSIATLIKARNYQVPIRFLVDVFIANRTTNIVPYLAISTGVLILGLTIAIFAFNYVRNIAINVGFKEKDHKYKQVSVKKALFKKEVEILTKNADYTVSYIGLLIVQPFLAFLIIKAMNAIFSSGVFAYFLTIVPDFIPLLDILLVMLFTVIIASGANEYIQMEKRTIKIMKTMPVKFKTQILIKVSIPFILSSGSLLITYLVLLIGGLIKLPTFIIGFVLSLILLTIFIIVSLIEELNIRNQKPRSTFVSTLYSYLLPILFFGVGALFSYLGISVYMSYLAALGIFIIFGIPHVINILKNLNSLFMELDVVN